MNSFGQTGLLKQRRLSEGFGAIVDAGRSDGPRAEALRLLWNEEFALACKKRMTALPAVEWWDFWRHGLNRPLMNWVRADWRFDVILYLVCIWVVVFPLAPGFAGVGLGRAGG